MCVQSELRRAKSRCGTFCWRCVSTPMTSILIFRCRRVFEPMCWRTERRKSFKANYSPKAEPSSTGTLTGSISRSIERMSGSTGTAVVAALLCRFRFSPAATSLPCAPRWRRRSNKTASGWSMSRAAILLLIPSFSVRVHHLRTRVLLSIGSPYA